MIYEVERKEIHYVTIRIEANDPEHARDLVADDQGDELEDICYHSTLSRDQWIVRYNGELVLD
jgi:hypothetical protein